jgi:hypothetical protein
LEQDIVLHNEALVFCQSSCASDYMHERVRAGHRKRFEAQMRPEGWKKLGPDPKDF